MFGQKHSTYIIGGSPSPFDNNYIKKHLSKEYTCQVEVGLLRESLTFFLRARNVMRLVIHHPCFSGKN